MSNKYSFGESGSRRRLPFLGFFVEILVIVIGIYIAFLVNEWGEKKKERQLEVNYLRELREEVEINWQELEVDQNFRRAQEVFLLKLMDARNRRVDMDTLREAFEYLMIYRFYSPTKAVYNDLISSGNLGLIQSDTIRHLILTDHQRTSRAPVSELSERKYVEDELTQYLVRRRVYSLLSLKEDIEEIQTSQRQKDQMINSLLQDTEFFDHVYARLGRLKTVLYFANPIQWNLRALRRKLDEELSRQG